MFCQICGNPLTPTKTVNRYDTVTGAISHILTFYACTDTPDHPNQIIVNDFIKRKFYPITTHDYLQKWGGMCSW
jgi:hypothetical protein